MDLKKDVYRRAIALTVALAFITVLAPIKAQAAEISDYWAEKDVDMRMEPHYENIAYTFDPIETLQRFDAKGVWYWPATTDMDDSKLTLTGATNASLNYTNDANLDDGTYFEVRVTAASIDGNFTFSLEDKATSDTVNMVLTVDATIQGMYSATDVDTWTGTLGTYVADTWYKLGIFFSGADVVFYAWYDNGTLLDSSSVSDANMTYSEVGEVDLSQSVALKTATVDYFVQTSTKTALDPVVQSSRALRVTTDETVTARNIAFTIDELPNVVTLSNDSCVYTSIGYTPTGVDITNDNKLNESDIGNVLMETPEDVDAKFRGPTVVKGWDSLRDAQDESIETFLEERHDVAQVYLIDYYCDDMKLNVTVTEGMADKITKSALNNFMDLSEDEGAEIEYDSDTGIYSNWEDFDYAYMPRDITAAEWVDMKKDLSNAIRKDTVSLVALTMDRPSNVVDPMFDRLNPFVVRISADVTGDLDVDTTYQLTNALIGSVLLGDEYCAVDAETLDTEMAGSEADGWDTIEDGKATTSGFSLVTVFNSTLIWIIVFSIIAVTAVVVLVMLKRKKKGGKKAKGKK